MKNLYKTYKIHNELSIGDFIDELNEPKFKELPLWAIVNPWSSLSIKKSRKVYLNGFYKNRSMHDLTFENFSKLTLNLKCTAMRLLRVKLCNMKNYLKS